MEKLALMIGTIDLSYGLWGNTLLTYSKAALAFVVLLLVFKFVQWLILNRLNALAEKTATDIDDTLIRIVKSLRPPFYYFVAFYGAIQFFVLNDFLSWVIDGILIAWITFQVVIALHILIDYVLYKQAQKDGEKQRAVGFLSNFIKWTLWFLGGLMVLSNLGINITSLVAGLGIGGIAIAFALQQILGDLFSSFALYFDKPFAIGDYIVVGEHSGTVEKIGIKTTRVRALQGEEIVIPNAALTSSRVQNFKKMKERRVSFGFGVLYETPVEKMKKIPKMVEEIFKSIKDVRLDRVHFLTFADSSLNFEVVYYVNSREYQIYVDSQQEINLKIMEAFEKEKIGFAYPTRTVYLAK